MKSKSFIAGALGVLLFFAGQSAPAQGSDIADPDRGSSTLPAPAQGSDIGAPDRGSSTLPTPDRGSSTLSPAAVPLPAQAPPAGGAAAKKPADTESLRSAGARGQGASSPAAAGTRSQGAPSPAAGEEAVAEERLPRTGMFWGVMAGMRLPQYDADDTDWGDMGGEDIEGRGTFNGGLFFGMDFGVVAGQAEVFFAGERASTKVLLGSYTDTDITGLSILVPLIVKLDLHLGPVALQPLAGLYLNFALGNLKENVDGSDREDPYANPPLGVLFGGALGISLGRGILFADIRYARDLGNTVAGNNAATIWNRSALMFNLGYQFSLGRKK